MSDGRIDCHTKVPMQCAGSAIFRSNICKVPRSREILQGLPSDRIRVFSTPQEFLNHHQNGPARSWSTGDDEIEEEEN